MVALNDVAVHCRGVTKTYGTGSVKVTALRGVDLDVRTGEQLMLVGHSGCGKTTLISVVAGILDRDDGDCSVFAQDLQQMRQQDRTRCRGEQIGFQIVYSFEPGRLPVYVGQLMDVFIQAPPAEGATATSATRAGTPADRPMGKGEKTPMPGRSRARRRVGSRGQGAEV